MNAVDAQNVIAPSGTAKIGQFEYDIATNSAPRTIEELNNLPVKVVGNSTIYVRDVSHVSDGFIPQTNIVRQDGRRGVLTTVIKDGDASTLSVVQGIRTLLPPVQQTLPPQLKTQQLADQSVFVRAAVSGVIREAAIAAVLTALMILVFLGSWRSTVIIVVSIPLAILSSVIILSFLHQTINLMTLGGLALAVGILVDDATVTIENISRHLEEGQPLHQGILEGAAQIAVPALVSTLCICIVFSPCSHWAAWRTTCFSRSPKRLSSPCSLRTSFRELWFQRWPCTFSSLGKKLLLPRAIPLRGHRRPSTADLKHFGLGYQRWLTMLVRRRGVFVPVFVLVCFAAAALVPWLGQDFFPNIDSGQFILHVRAKTGTRIEDTAMLCDQIERSIRREIPGKEVATITDNIGLPYSQLNYMYSTNGAIGSLRCRYSRFAQRETPLHARLHS